MNVLGVLADRAFHRASPAEANLAIDEARALAGGGAALGTSYELVVPALDAGAWLATQALPRLVHFLDCRGLRAPHTPGLFVSLFTPDALLFIDAGAVVEVLAAARGLTLAEVQRRYGDGGAGDPPLLGA